MNTMTLAMTGDADTIERFDRAIDRLVRFHPDGRRPGDRAGRRRRPGADGPRADRLPPPDEHRSGRPRHGAHGPRGDARRRRQRARAGPRGGDRRLAGRRLGRRRAPPRRPARALAERRAGAHVRAPARLLHRRRARRCATGRSARCGRSIPTTRTPPFVRGMASFGLEEAGHYGEALAAGLAAVEANPDDVWAHPRRRPHLRDAGSGRRGHRLPALRSHAVGVGQPVHRAQLVAPRPVRAGGRSSRAVAGHLRRRGPPRRVGSSVPIEMLDASALLWRLLLDGIDTGGRFGPLADSWAPKATAEPWYVFNDLHATMAFAGAGRLADAHELIGRLDRWLDSASGSNARMTAEIGLPGVPRRRRLRRGAPRRRRRRAVPDPARRSPTSAAPTPSATPCSARCSSRRCAAAATSSPPR